MYDAEDQLCLRVSPKESFTTKFREAWGKLDARKGRVVPNKVVQKCVGLLQFTTAFLKDRGF